MLSIRNRFTYRFCSRAFRSNRLLFCTVVPFVVVPVPAPVATLLQLLPPLLLVLPMLLPLVLLLLPEEKIFLVAFVLPPLLPFPPVVALRPLVPVDHDNTVVGASGDRVGMPPTPLIARCFLLGSLLLLPPPRDPPRFAFSAVWCVCFVYLFTHIFREGGKGRGRGGREGGRGRRGWEG